MIDYKKELSELFPAEFNEWVNSKNDGDFKDHLIQSGKVTVKDYEDWERRKYPLGYKEMVEKFIAWYEHEIITDDNFMHAFNSDMRFAFATVYPECEEVYLTYTPKFIPVKDLKVGMLIWRNWDNFVKISSIEDFTEEIKVTFDDESLYFRKADVEKGEEFPAYIFIKE